MLDVADNTNNRYPVSLRIARPTDTFAKWVFISEILSHKRFIRDAYQRCLLVEVLRTKISSCLRRNLHNLEVVTQHAASFHTRFITRRNRRPVLD